MSVLPDDAGTGEGHSIGGTQIPAGPSTRTVTVIVNKQAIPTAQISALAFEDIYPTNGAPEATSRVSGIQIALEDAGGRYGISAAPRRTPR